MMAIKTLRVLHVIVQPVLVLDDGEELFPGPEMSPAKVLLSELPHIADEIKKQVEAAQPSK